MKIFIWEDIEDITNSYHSGGGAVVICESHDRAIELVPKLHNAGQPNIIFEVDAPEEKIVIFPDSGCC